MRTSALLPLFAAALAGGCDAGLDEDGPGPATAIADADEKADTATDLKAHVDGFTVWAAPGVAAATRNQARAWIVSGRTSKNLNGIKAFVTDGPIGTATVKSPRTFEIALADGDLDTLLGGEPLLLTFSTATGSYGAEIAVAARFARFAGGGSSITPSLRPIAVEGELVLRGRATVNLGYDQLAVASDGGGVAAVAADGLARHFRFDLAPADALAAGLAPAAPVHLRASGAQGAATKSAGLDFTVAQLGLTVGDPQKAWPPAGCDPAVKTCLAGLAHGADTETCGRYRAVIACTPAQPLLCGAPLDASLLAASQGLRYLSESDYPFEIWHRLGAGGAPLTAPQLLKLLGKPANTPVTVRSLDEELSWIDVVPDMVDEATSARFHALRDLLHAQMPDVQVFRVGTIEVHLYFVGRTSCGDLGGLTSIAIET
jgi:Nuclease A inhibitor-like protein